MIGQQGKKSWGFLFIFWNASFFNGYFNGVLEDIGIYPSQIYNQEVRILLSSNMEIETISNYLRPYNYYKSTFEKLRETIRPKNPKESDEMDFSVPEALKYTLTEDSKPFLLWY